MEIKQITPNTYNLIKQYPHTIRMYGDIRRIGYNFSARSLPRLITSVFLPFDLSASKSGNDVTYKTQLDSIPTIIPL